MPAPLFTTRVGGAIQSVFQQQYVVSPDGQRFLMSTVTETHTRTYEGEYPVLIVGDSPESFAFTVAVDERRFASLGNLADDSTETDIRRRYVTRRVQQRYLSRSSANGCSRRTSDIAPCADCSSRRACQTARTTTSVPRAASKRDIASPSEYSPRPCDRRQRAHVDT